MNKAHVIGMGEVGRRLAGALERAGWDVARVTREAGWEAAVDPGDRVPRIVAVREEALAAVLATLPPALRRDTVLVQNGFLEAVHGDAVAPATAPDGATYENRGGRPRGNPGAHSGASPCGSVTRGLVWFTSKGDFFRVLCPSLFHGPHADALCAALERGGIPVEAVPDRATFTREMIVKGVWNCVVGLPLAVHDVDLADYLRDRRDELDALVAESVAAASAEYGVAVDTESTVRKLLETTGDLGWVRGGAKALAWRNGAIAVYGRRHAVATPVNDRLLAAVGYTVEDS